MGKFFRHKGFKVYGSDMLYFSYSLRGVQGFIGTHYAPNPTNARMYFTQENAQKIDAMRLLIEQWKNDNHIIECEYFARF